MALFGLFKKKELSTENSKKGFHQLTVESIEKLTADTVKIIFTVPDSLKKEFHFIPGQYLNLAIELDGQDERRSYSICSGPDEKLAIAVKAVKNGKISSWLTSKLVIGQSIFVAKPQGNFLLSETNKNIVAIAAGSGITPILSIAKSLEKRNGRMELFYGNRTLDSIIFKQELDTLKNTLKHYFLSGETIEGYDFGRLDKENFTNQIKANLDILKADGYFICGPEQMILDVSSTLEFFGVAKSKIHFELFTTPVLMKQEEKVVVSEFNGESKVTAILDAEKVEFTLSPTGKTLLDAAEKAGLDAPFSCRGGVCCSCKAKIIKGSATMKMNYSLTDKEIQEGYILTCQAHPSSEELTISYDA